MSLAAGADICEGSLVSRIHENNGRRQSLESDHLQKGPFLHMGQPISGFIMKDLDQ